MRSFAAILIEKAAAAGMRSVFIGFETLSQGNLIQSNKKQNLNKDYGKAIRRLHSLGIMINGSFVFGLDEALYLSLTCDVWSIGRIRH
jgi:radical SAM superfamily enzyme YgiQ (UPF0313 family)